MSVDRGSPDFLAELLDQLDYPPNTLQESDMYQNQEELLSELIGFDSNSVCSANTEQSILDEYINVPSEERSSTERTSSDSTSYSSDYVQVGQCLEHSTLTELENSSDTHTITLQQETCSLVPSLPASRTVQDSNRIEMLSQPKPFIHANYSSRGETGFPRYIQGVHQTVDRKTYKFPAVQLPPDYLMPNQNLFICVTAVTVDQNYIHPYTLKIPTDNTADIFCKNNSVFYRIIPNQNVDSNHGMTFYNLMFLKLKRDQLREYGNLYSYKSGEQSMNTKKEPKDMIKDYDLKKAKLAFSIVQLNPLNEYSWQCIDNVFSDVMEEVETNQKASDAISKPVIRARARKRRCSNANNRISTSDSENEQDAYTQDWATVFEDVFNQNDGRVDLRNWAFEEGTGENGWGTHQEQYYTPCGERNARVESGHLMIKARKEISKSRQYTSARLRSIPAFLYGRLQFRAKLPSGRGTWSCICLLPENQTYGNAMWPDNGEMNIALLGHQSSKVASSVATLSCNSMWNNLPYNALEVADATTDFHIYTLLWTPQQIEMFVGPEKERALERRILIWMKDGKDWRKWPFDQPFQIVIYLAVGGDVAGVEGIDDDKFPQQMEIDWIRFDQRV